MMMTRSYFLSYVSHRGLNEYLVSGPTSVDCMTNEDYAIAMTAGYRKNNEVYEDDDAGMHYGNLERKKEEGQYGQYDVGWIDEDRQDEVVAANAVEGKGEYDIHCATVDKMRSDGSFAASGHKANRYARYSLE